MPIAGMDNNRAGKALKDVIALETLGCKLNQAESESLARRLNNKGYTLSDFSSNALVYILNTCTVTHLADRKTRHLIRTARRHNPNATIVAIGCYADSRPDELISAGADLAIGNEGKSELIQLLEQHRLIGSKNSAQHYMLRTRSRIKIQEGCTQFCSYCVVPLVRGKERSLPLETILSEVKARANEGYREVVLTGTRIGTYRPSLDTLVRRILCDTHIERLRLSSLQPSEVTDEFLSLWADNRLCRHLHLPLQSGSNDMLRVMRRPYTITDYENVINRIRKAIPDVAITTDIIVGFPGETAETFNESCDFCRSMSFANIHVFPYSDRPGTRATIMTDKAGAKTKRARRDRMLQLAQESSRNFRNRFIGRNMMVLWEQRNGKGSWTGLTDNYIRVTTQSNDNLGNTITAHVLADGTSTMYYNLERAAPV